MPVYVYILSQYTSFMTEQKPALPVNTILKIQFKETTLPWYWTCSVSIIILSYLLTFVQLTWQVNNG